MKLLLDTHVLLWYSCGVLPPKAADLIYDRGNELFFSPANIWEIVTKYNLGRSDFRVSPNELYRRLLNDDCAEIPLSSGHMLVISELPNIHKDPFDRILLAQAIREGCSLLTADITLAKYPGPIILV